MPDTNVRSRSRTPEVRVSGSRRGRDEDLPEDAYLPNGEVDRFHNIDISIEHQGSKIVLPNDPHQMSTEEAIQALERKKAAETQTVMVNEIVETFPFDGAYAFMRAMQLAYGWTTPVPTGFWQVPPAMVAVETSYGQYSQVIWGSFQIPGLEGTLRTGVDTRDGRTVFSIQGTVKQRDVAQVAKLADLTRRIVREQSLYRGKAITLKTDSDGDLDLDQAPGFVDLSRVRPEELIFSATVEEQIRTNLFTPVERTERCRREQIPLKRGILLAGPYGTGKTLTAYTTARKCVDNGWTFIMIPRASGLADALAFAKMYQPAVLFTEDIDRVTDGDRSEEMDDLLNTIDGIGSKNTEIITILTTNDAEAINRAMLRPGRLDAVIIVDPPDAEAAQRLIRLYGRGLIPDAEDLSEAGEVLDGEIPAVIREVVERSKLYAISRLEDADGEIILAGSDIAGAARGMKRHLDLLRGEQKEAPPAHHRLGDNMLEIISNVVSLHAGGSSKLHNNVVAIGERLDVEMNG